MEGETAPPATRGLTASSGGSGSASGGSGEAGGADGKSDEGEEEEILDMMPRVCIKFVHRGLLYCTESYFSVARSTLV